MMKHRKVFISILVFVLFLHLPLIGMYDPEVGLEVGKKLPTFKLPNINGAETTLQEFIGKIVIIHLWKCK